MGWGNQAFPLLIIEAGGGFTGLFVYSPAPGPGNLIDSIAAQAGTDPYGNAYQPGITSYFPASGASVSLNNGSVIFGSTVAQSVLSGGSYSLSTLIGTGVTIVIGPSGDASGATDFSNIGSALLSGNAVQLMPGTYFTNALLTAAGTSLTGAGMATIIKPGTGYTGALLAVGNKGSISNLAPSNSATDAVTVAGGISDVWLSDLFFSSNAGLCINWTVTGTTHGHIRGIRGASGGTANGGGIAINGGTGAGHSAQVNIYDIDIQNCQASEVLLLSSVFDVTADIINGSIGAAVAANGITIEGACQTCHLDNLDIGGGTGTAVCVLQAAGGTSPSDIWVQGKLQSGTRGLVVNDATSRCRFYVDCTHNQLDGAQFNDTGISNKIMLMANANNQAAGVAYDISVTSSGHVYIDAPQYGTPGGGAVTANLNCTIAGNHVTHASPPAGSSTVGFAPAGW